MKKEKESSYYNSKTDKARLELMKASYGVKYESKAPKEQKEIARRLIQEQEGKISSQEKIGKQEKKIYKHSVQGKIDNLGNRFYKQLQQKIVSRKVLKPNKMSVHIKERKPESSWNDENRFFKGNFEKEKRSMFLE